MLVKENIMITGTSRRFFRITFMIVMIMVTLACSTLGKPTSNTSDESDNLSATKALGAATETQPAQPTNTPNAVPTETRTPIPTVTLTPLPTLPDFDKVLTFGGGGAGFSCTTTAPLYSFSGTPAGFLTGELGLCIVLATTEFDSPFTISVLAPDGEVFTTNSIVINQITQEVEWDGYSGFNGNFAFLGEDGNLYVDLYLTWRARFLEGLWRIFVDFDNGLKLIDDTVISKPAGSSNIAAVSAGYRYEIVPRTSDLGLRPVKLRDNGKLHVIGSDFPPNAVVYILLYRTDDFSRAEFVQKYSVDSDSAGLIEAEISASFEFGQPYYLIGITDSNTPLGLGDCPMEGCGYASDLFEIIP